jgi:hypothetical protein
MFHSCYKSKMPHLSGHCIPKNWMYDPVMEGLRMHTTDTGCQSNRNCKVILQCPAPGICKSKMPHLSGHWIIGCMYIRNRNVWQQSKSEMCEKKCRKMNVWRPLEYKWLQIRTKIKMEMDGTEPGWPDDFVKKSPKPIFCKKLKLYCYRRKSTPKIALLLTFFLKNFWK